jgi:hypothetical protein
MILSHDSETTRPRTSDFHNHHSKSSSAFSSGYRDSELTPHLFVFKINTTAFKKEEERPWPVARDDNDNERRPVERHTPRSQPSLFSVLSCSFAAETA